jgi:AcrR family transcriptional regulator
VKLDRHRQAARVLLRKLDQGKEGPEAIARLLAQDLPQKPSSEGDVEELARWFVALRDTVSKGSIQGPSSFSRLLEVFRQLVKQRGVDPEAFYVRVLEHLVLRSEGEEPSSMTARRSTRERILEAALDVFSEKGFHLATVDEIAERAGLGKGTVYRHFANKETLFNDLVQSRLEELERDAKTVLDGQDDVLTMITKYLRIYFAFFDRNQRLYRLVVQEGLDVGRQVQDLYVKTVMRRIPVLKRKIYAASQQGELKDVDFQTVFYGVMGFVHGVIEKWLASDCSYSLVDELPVVVEVLFYGFVRNGHHVELGQEEGNGTK